MDKSQRSGPKATKFAERAERLAEALRQNLRKRKAQARRRNAAAEDVDSRGPESAPPGKT